MSSVDTQISPAEVMQSIIDQLSPSDRALHHSFQLIRLCAALEKDRLSQGHNENWYEPSWSCASAGIVKYEASGSDSYEDAQQLIADIVEGLEGDKGFDFGEGTSDHRASSDLLFVPYEPPGSLHQSLSRTRSLIKVHFIKCLVQLAQSGRAKIKSRVIEIISKRVIDRIPAVRLVAIRALDDLLDDRHYGSGRSPLRLWIDEMNKDKENGPMIFKKVFSKPLEDTFSSGWQLRYKACDDASQESKTRHAKALLGTFLLIFSKRLGLDNDEQVRHFANESMGKLAEAIDLIGLENSEPGLELKLSEWKARRV